MSMFEEDFSELMKKAEGFEDIPEEAKRGMRVIAFTMWCKGISRLQNANTNGTLSVLLMEMVRDVLALDEGKKTERSKEKLQ
jgi:hypothetical protein